MGKLKIATLFSGIGTPENALKALQVEHETIFACEIDKYARVTYLANNDEPNTFYDDVYNIDGKKYLNQIDILIGGSPCQSFSIAGKRLGTSCPRGNLIYEYFRIVEEAKPKVFIYENVKGFLSIDKGETFENFKNSFKEIGYTVYHQVLNTKDYGIPQNRERIYIVGFKDNVDFHFQEKQELKLKLKDILEDSVDSKYLLNQELVEKYIQTGTASNHKGSQAGKVADEADEADEHFWTVNAGTHGYSMGYIKINKKYHLSKEAIEYMNRKRDGIVRWENRSNKLNGIAHCISANFYKGVPYGVIEPYTPIRLNQTHQLNIKGNDSIKRIYSSDGLCPSLTTMQGGHREPKVAIEKEIIKLFDIPKEILNDNERQRRVYSSEGISPAVIARSDSAKILINNDSHVLEKVALPVREEFKAIDEVMSNNYIFRKLTPRECFRLQGFDDTFIFPEKMSDTQLYKQAGNGMSRNILEMLFTQILIAYTKHIEEKQNENI